MSTTRGELNIYGMSDEEGTEAIEQCIYELDGVESVAVDLTANQVIVGYDDEKLSMADIIQQVEEAGYSLTGPED